MSRIRVANMSVEVKGAVMATSPRVLAEQRDGEQELRRLLGDEAAEPLFENRRKRDGSKAHITILSPPDAKQAVASLAARDGISKGEAERRIKTLAAEGVPDTFRVRGIGKAESGGRVAYFLVVDWPGGRAWRESVGLDPDGQDFHITLGFGPEGDVHGVRKDRLMRASRLSMKQAATGNALFDVKQELRGGHDLVEDGNYFDYEYVNLASEAIKDAIRRLQGAGFLDFSMDEDGVLMATRPGGIEAEVEFDSWEENGRPWTEVGVEVIDPERSGEFKMASHDLRSRVIRLAHAKPELRSALLPLLRKAYGVGPYEIKQPPGSPQLGPRTEFHDMTKKQIEDYVGSGRSLGRADLSGLNLYSVNFNGASLSKANLKGTYLSRAILVRADLDNADLTGADLTGANLVKANLGHADLTGATLRGADLTKAKISSAILVGANLIRAELLYAYLSFSDLTGADLTGADLRGAYFGDAKLRDAKLQGATWDDKTHWPKGFTPPDDSERV